MADHGVRESGGTPFCYFKQKNVPADKRGKFGYGDVWTWLAMDADRKLVPSHRIGPRHLGEATAFMTDLAGRLRNRVQLTTDGLRPYLLAVEGASTVRSTPAAREAAWQRSRRLTLS